MDKRVQLKIKIKSLAAESKIIRAETKKAPKWLKGHLHHHRVMDVRIESRYAQLAYAFLRNVDYSQVEYNAKKAVNWEKLRDTVNRFSWCHYDIISDNYIPRRKWLTQLDARWKSWHENAKLHIMNRGCKVK
jgi:hypothetical protein